MTKLITQPRFPVTRSEFMTPFESLFDRFWNDTHSQLMGNDFFHSGSYPKCNILSLSDRIEIEAAVPGLSQDCLDISLDGQVLTIRGDSNQREGVSDGDYYRREVKRSAFSRSFRLNDSLDLSGIGASCENGMLTLRIPRKDSNPSSVSSRKIEIS